MIKKNLILAVFLAAWSIAFISNVNSSPISDQGKPSIPAIKVGTSYDEVRKILIKNGWTPYHGANATPCTPEEERCKGRPEMQTCSDVGTGRCSWLWKKEKTIVIIKTQDDDLFFSASKFYGK